MCVCVYVCVCVCVCVSVHIFFYLKMKLFLEVAIYYFDCLENRLSGFHVTLQPINRSLSKPSGKKNSPLRLIIIPLNELVY